MATVAPQDSIDMARVISRGFDALFKNAGPFFAASLLLAGLPSFLFQWWMFGYSTDVSGNPHAFFPSHFWSVTAASFIIAMVVSGALAQSIIVRSTVLYLDGRPADALRSAGIVFGLVLPIVGLSLMVTIIVGVGLILLIVPGVILALMYCVAMPVLIEERCGVFASLSRSNEMTSDSKPLIFVLMILYFLFSWAVSFVFSIVVGIGALSTEYSFLPFAGEAAATTVATAVLSTMVSSLYIELRTMKEGASTDLMAEIFE